MGRLSRNKLCICGSGIKTKKCCLLKVGDQSFGAVDERVKQAIGKVIVDDKALRGEGIEELKSILAKEKLPKHTLIEATLNMAIGLQHNGEHKSAITAIETLSDHFEGSPGLLSQVNYHLAVSYSALGYSEYACKFFDSLLEDWSTAPSTDPQVRKTRAFKLIEAGKAYMLNGNEQRAIECWEASIRDLEKFGPECLEPIGRARANIAIRKLKSRDEATQEQGVEVLDASTADKLKLGDMKGVANNYCNLAAYFQEKKRYGRAIAYYRKDLYLSRMIGDKRDLASTLGNFALLYAKLKQFKPARKLLSEAKEIGRELQDSHLLAISDGQLKYITRLAREAGVAKVGIGEKAVCECGSQILYDDCCGMADFEPVNLPYIYGGFSEEAAEIHEQFSSLGISPCPLDFILREIPIDSIRHSWMEHRMQDGWVSIAEMPDMASIHLYSAREILKSQSKAGVLSCALSAIILAICYLEAFINQISFFLHQNKDEEYVATLNVPEQLSLEGPLAYQKQNSLELKWKQLSDCLNGDGWLAAQPEWQSVKDAIFIRNEFVHFKSSGYEQVVPPTKKKDVIYSKIPNSVSINEVPHSWPFKILTESLALWVIESAESLVGALKANYSKSRRVSRPAEHSI